VGGRLRTRGASDRFLAASHGFRDGIGESFQSHADVTQRFLVVRLA